MEKKRPVVAVGLSGGVDSSVAAHLLMQQGYDVIAIFMINWHDTVGLLEGDCPAHDDRLIAELVARKLDIPFHVRDFSEDYSHRVVDYMFNEYEKGRTPNPDVLCNREIKFDPFIKAAEELGADYFATGHYCRKETIKLEDGTSMHRLLAGTDPNKDQSYFLCQLSQEQLSKVLFPVGHLLKPEVRRIATELNLPTAERKDSQGICFVGKVSLPEFLQQKLKSKEGDIIEIPKDYAYPLVKTPDPESPEFDDELRRFARPFSYRPWNGKTIGKHPGAHYYTIGQRKGLNVGGKPEPLFVLATDVERNFIYTGQGHDHPGLNRSALFIARSELHWIRVDQEAGLNEVRRYQVRIRYRQSLQEATFYFREKGLYILFDVPQRGITSGQFAAWYDEDELVGSGVISS
ncbi:MAG: tRNA 2-thiouridine(34) synthase MnmA [Sphingobacteriia bacterium]|nr:tRNA 2-thiouridine(34) synthase MnmA [Sphingobacteriia bacterium]